MKNQQASQLTKQKVWRKIERGRYSDALLILKKFIKAQPGDAEAQHMVGCCHASLSQWNEAQKHLQSSIQIQPHIPQSHYALAGVLKALGQTSEAVKSLNNVLSLNSRHTDAYVALANIEMKQGKFSDARNHLERALKIDPKMSDAYFALGRLEQESGEHKKAVPYFEQAINHNVKFVKALCAMGNALGNLARKDEAKNYYLKALQVDPNSVEANSSLAMLYNFNAEFNKAYQLINPMLKKKVYQASLAIAFARLCEHVDRCQDAIDYIEKVLKQTDISNAQRKGLYFAAGKVLDSMGQYDNAFAKYKLGNDAMGQNYDSAENIKETDDIIQTFTPELFLKLPLAGNRDERPIFIIGMPRSGTSLTEQILAAHSDVCAAGELETLFEISCNTKLNPENKGPFPFYVDKLNQDGVDNMADTYLKHLDTFSGQTLRLTDKMPHNFNLLGLVQLLFPKARIIHCRRDPMDTCLSIYFQDFSEGHKYAKNLLDIGAHYVQYQRLMKHWQKVLSIPIFVIQYEDLVSNQADVTKNLLKFCGLEWNDDCLHFHSVKRTIDTASYDQVRQPLYTKSVKRWKHYESHLDDLKKSLGVEV